MRTATAKIDSKSRNVRSYVRASLKARKLEAQAAKARTLAIAAKAKLNGTMLAEAERLLKVLSAVDANVAEVLATPCKRTPADKTWETAGRAIAGMDKVMGARQRPTDLAAEGGLGREASARRDEERFVRGMPGHPDNEMGM